jgi:hypothetical protein
MPSQNMTLQHTTLTLSAVCKNGAFAMPEPISLMVERALAATPAIDMHTHLFAPHFGGLALSGIDHLLTYHYLGAEFFRESKLTPAIYWSLPLQQRAEAIWQTLFVDNPPLSEGTRGVVAILSALGFDPCAKDLVTLRRDFAALAPEGHVERVLTIAGVDRVVMTNDPLDPSEAPEWDRVVDDERFQPALRLDRILNEGAMSDVRETCAFLEAWTRKMRPLYMAVSLPGTFQYPEESVRVQLLRDAVLPVCREFDIPMALMIGVRRQVNPALRLAGDALERADLRALESICRDFPKNRFLVAVLSRENQHELCVLARKFSNLLLFGCWWFLNNSSIVEKMTTERLEMLGHGFIAQNSDARVLEQLIYKWRNTRRTLASVLTRQYELLAQDGRPVSRADVTQTVTRLLRTNFEHWTHS